MAVRSFGRPSATPSGAETSQPYRVLPPATCAAASLSGSRNAASESCSSSQAQVAGVRWPLDVSRKVLSAIAASVDLRRQRLCVLSTTHDVLVDEVAAVDVGNG